MKNNITPIVTAEYNEEIDGYDVEVQLPGAHKEDIDLKVLPGGFMIRAPRADEEDTVYVEATFDEGLLKAQFKSAEPFAKATKISIE